MTSKRITESVLAGLFHCVIGSSVVGVLSALVLIGVVRLLT